MRPTLSGKSDECWQRAVYRSELSPNEWVSAGGRSAPLRKGRAEIIRRVSFARTCVLFGLPADPRGVPDAVLWCRCRVWRVISGSGSAGKQWHGKHGRTRRLRREGGRRSMAHSTQLPSYIVYRWSTAPLVAPSAYRAKARMPSTSPCMPVAPPITYGIRSLSSSCRCCCSWAT